MIADIVQNLSSKLSFYFLRNDWLTGKSSVLKKIRIYIQQMKFNVVLFPDNY